MAKQFKGNPLMDGSMNLAEITQSVAYSDFKPGNVQKRKADVPASERGCKFGYTRHTYLLSKDMVENVRKIANFFGWTETATLEQLLRKGIDEAVAKYGIEMTDPSYKRRLF